MPASAYSMRGSRHERLCRWWRLLGKPNSRRSFVKRMLLAAALATTIAIAVPIIARSADDAPTQQAQAAPIGEHGGDERGGSPEPWMRGEGRPGMQGWRGMMMGRMMQHRNPQERCEERLAWRAAMRAYTETK